MCTLFQNGQGLCGTRRGRECIELYFACQRRIKNREAKATKHATCECTRTDRSCPTVLVVKKSMSLLYRFSTHVAMLLPCHQPDRLSGRPGNLILEEASATHMLHVLSHDSYSNAQIHQCVQLGPFRTKVNPPQISLQSISAMLKLNLFQHVLNPAHVLPLTKHARPLEGALQDEMMISRCQHAKVVYVNY